jgi:hypothetical protein
LLKGSDSLGINRITEFKITFYRIKKARGSSYIATPEPFNNSRCGLINIQNTDEKCFSWCLKYHQSEQIKHCDRTTTLNTIEDNYNYEGVNYPASFDDIKTFETNNEVCINVYSLNGSNVNLDYIGNIDFIKNDIIYLLRIENEDKAHYIYIKHIQRLLNLNTYTKKDKKR